jgi:biopolymer transport protein ExbD
MKKRKHEVRRLFVRPASGTNSDINVTPLVDVVLVLLIIFMVVTPLLEKDIPVRTPNSEKVEEVVDVPQDQLVVYVNKDGALRINSEQVSAADYVGKLKGALASKAEIDRIVFIVADDGCNYGKFVHVLDGAREAGAQCWASRRIVPIRRCSSDCSRTEASGAWELRDRSGRGGHQDGGHRRGPLRPPGRSGQERLRQLGGRRREERGGRDLRRDSPGARARAREPLAGAQRAHGPRGARLAGGRAPLA